MVRIRVLLGLDLVIPGCDSAVMLTKSSPLSQYTIERNLPLLCVLSRFMITPFARLTTDDALVVADDELALAIVADHRDDLLVSYGVLRG